MPLLYKGTGMKIHTSKSVRRRVVSANHRRLSVQIATAVDDEPSVCAQTTGTVTAHAKSTVPFEALRSFAALMPCRTRPQLPIQKLCPSLLSIPSSEWTSIDRVRFHQDPLGTPSTFGSLHCSQLRNEYRLVDHIEHRHSRRRAHQSKVRSTLPPLAQAGESNHEAKSETSEQHQSRKRERESQRARSSF